LAARGLGCQQRSEGIVSRSVRVVGGVGLGQLHLVLVTLVGLWLTPLLLTTVGQHEYGLWLLGLQLLAYLHLLDLGVVALLPREAAQATGRVLAGEPPAIVAATVARIRTVIRWQVPLVLLACIAVFLLLPGSWAELRWPIAWVLLFFAISFPCRAYAALLQGLQDLVFLAQLQLVAWVVGTATLLLLLTAGAGLHALAGGWVVTQATTVVGSWWRIRAKHRGAWAAQAPTLAWTDVRTFFGRSIWISLAQVAHVLLAGSDVLLIGALLGPAAVVPYACTARLVQVLANHPQMIMQAAAPALSQMRMAESRERLAVTMAALTRAMLVVSGGVGCLVIAVNEAFVGWWVGPGQFGGATLTILLVAAMLARHLNTTTVYGVFCFGHERRLSITAFADGMITALASLLLVPHFGVSGVAVGSLIGVLSVSYAPNLLVLARELGVAPARLLGGLSGWFGCFAACASAALLVARLPVQDSFLDLLVRGGAIGALYVVVMLPLVLRGPLGAYVRQVAVLPSWARQPQASRKDAA
jgi:O-antigen/teichoic acid export membrane protein